MTQPTIGLQIYTVWEAFMNGNDPEGLFRQIRALGYEAVELYNTMLFYPAERIRDALAAADLRCCSMSIEWNCGEKGLSDWIRYNEVLGNRRLFINSAVPAALRKRESLRGIVRTLNDWHDELQSAGFTTGYHAHYTDFFMVDGVSSYDRILQGTPEDFCMVVDTGNMLSAGANPIHYLRKYPGRSPVVHLKPFDWTRQTGATMIGEDSFDWPTLLRACLDDGKADSLVVEYSSYARYQPLEAAALCYNRLQPMLQAAAK